MKRKGHPRLELQVNPELKNVNKTQYQAGVIIEHFVQHEYGNKNLFFRRGLVSNNFLKSKMNHLK
jgi:hypothetical protein